MKIGIDFDDVIAWSHLLKPMLAERLFGKKINPDIFQRKQVIGGGLLTQDQYDLIGREVFSGKYPMNPVPGSLFYIRALQEEGHEIQIVTSRSDKGGTLAPALEWLELQRLNVPVTGAGYGRSKAVACAGLDVFVDDDVNKLRPLVGIVSHVIHLCWPYDRSEALVDGVERVSSWDEIYKAILFPVR